MRLHINIQLQHLFPISHAVFPLWATVILQTYSQGKSYLPKRFYATLPSFRSLTE